MKSSIRFVVLVIGLGFVLLGATRLFNSASWSRWTNNSDDQSPLSEFESFVFSFRDQADESCDDSDAHEHELFITREFNVSPGERLNVDVSSADVSVDTWSENIARVEVFVAGHNDHQGPRSTGTASAGYVPSDFDISYTNGIVSLRQATNHGRRGHNGGASIKVTIPTEFSINIETSAGDIDSADITGNVILKSDAGDVSCGVVKGKIVDLVSSAGDIRIEAIDVEDNVHVHTSAGDIHADEIKALVSKLSTSAGDVQIGKFTGSLEASSAAGNLDISELIGSLIGKTSAGDIQVLVRNATSPLQLESQVGDISVTYPSDASLEFDLAAPDIIVNGKHIKSGTIPNITRHVSSINGGETTMRVSTRLGTVHVAAN